MEEKAGPERVVWAESRLRQDASLSAEERLDLLVVLGSLATRRFGDHRLSDFLRSIMLDSPFWEKQRALERARMCSSVLLKFAKARKLVMPPDAEQRLAQQGAAALEHLVELVATEPESAVQALLTTVNSEAR